MCVYISVRRVQGADPTPKCVVLCIVNVNKIYHKNCKMTVLVFLLFVYAAYVEMERVHTLYWSGRTVYFQKILQNDLYGIVLRCVSLEVVCHFLWLRRRRKSDSIFAFFVLIWSL